MEGTAYLQDHCLSGPLFFRQLTGSQHRLPFAGYNNLFRRIIIGYFTDAFNIPTDFFNYPVFKADDCCHTALIIRHSLIHQYAPLADQPEAFFKAEYTGSSQGRIFSQAMASYHCRIDTFLIEETIYNITDRIDGWLCIFRKTQFFGRTVKT